MLESLKINGGYVDFRKHNPIQFQPGLTLITGKNGAGKTLVGSEMIRFALFGSKALRRPASDYKKLDVELCFAVRGVSYRVTRSPSKALLSTADGFPIATGTTPVNAAVISLFGYGLAVFDIANCCNQNQVLAFSDRMLPTERKKLIDQTIGLAAIDELAAELGNEALAMGRDLKSLQSRWESAPEEPAAPASPLSVDALRAEVAVAHQAFVNVQVLKNALSQPLPELPEEPLRPEWFETFDADAAHQQSQILTKAQERRTFLLGATANPPTAPEPYKAPEQPKPYLCPHTIEQLEAAIAVYQELNTLERQLASLDLPALTIEQIEAGKNQLALASDWKAAQKLKLQGEAECPSCGHHFPNAHKALEHYAHVVGLSTCPEAPLAADYLAHQLGLHGNYAKATALKAQIDVLKPQLVFNAQDMLRNVRASAQAQQAWVDEVARGEAQAKIRLTAYDNKREIFDAHLSELAGLPDMSAYIEGLRQRLHELATYQQALSQALLGAAAYQRAVSAQVEQQAALLTLEPVAATLPGLQAALETRLVYEADYRSYTKRKADYDADYEKIAELEQEVADLKAGKAALVDLKILIKSHLLPSLNMVASRLLSEMTGGTMQGIRMDDDFEIFIDGVHIQALSGSGQAVANLALRLGLGQVLTNKVFSVFMGDELDGSMDAERSVFLVECLKNLRGSINQILLVTHKDLTEHADQVIRLG